MVIFEKRGTKFVLVETDFHRDQLCEPGTRESVVKDLPECMCLLPIVAPGVDVQGDGRDGARYKGKETLHEFLRFALEVDLDPQIPEDFARRKSNKP